MVDDSGSLPSACVTCKKARPSGGLRRGMCRACYLRAWRGTELPVGASCATCDERRHPVLRWTRLCDEKIITCQNCGFLADRLRPRAASLDDLKQRMERERRIGRERRRDYSIDPSDPSERRLMSRRARRTPLSL